MEYTMTERDLLPRDKTVDRSVQEWNKATQSVCIITMTIFFGLRLYTRIFITRGFGKEDWTCAVAWLLGVAYSVIALIMGHFGGGLHIDDVPKENIIPFEKTVYVTMVMYGPTAYLTKVSLLWIMTRVFSPYKKAVIGIYVFMGLMLAYYVPAVIVKIRICDPISKFWNTDSPGTCLDQTAIIMADAVMSVLSDTIVLILPLPLTLSLQMSTKRKMRVMGILGAGGLAVASSIVRLVLIVLTGQSKDATMAFMRVNMFGNAEIAIGVICACLPALSALISKTYREYSSNKATHSSTHELSKMRNQSQTQRSGKSRNQMSYIETGSDEDILVRNAQGQPKIETTIHGEHEQPGYRQNNDFESIGIMKSVQVSTQVTSR